VSTQRQKLAENLRAIIERYHPVALRGDPEAANIVLRAMELQARVLGIGE
jgi:hypothetical protein